MREHRHLHGVCLLWANMVIGVSETDSEYKRPNGRAYTKTRWVIQGQNNAYNILTCRDP